MKEEEIKKKQKYHKSRVKFYQKKLDKIEEDKRKIGFRY